MKRSARPALAANDAHAAGNYRAHAPAQHEPGFCKAFGIRKGNAMLLEPRERVAIW